MEFIFTFAFLIAILVAIFGIFAVIVYAFAGDVSSSLARIINKVRW